jgi:hypothetical protein
MEAHFGGGEDVMVRIRAPWKEKSQGFMACEVLSSNIAGIFATTHCVVQVPGDQILTFIYTKVASIRSELERNLLG